MRFHGKSLKSFRTLVITPSIMDNNIMNYKVHRYIHDVSICSQQNKHEFVEFEEHSCNIKKYAK
jgi:hypothetical protein